MIKSNELRQFFLILAFIISLLVATVISVQYRKANAWTPTAQPSSTCSFANGHNIDTLLIKIEQYSTTANTPFDFDTTPFAIIQSGSTSNFYVYYNVNNPIYFREFNGSQSLDVPHQTVRLEIRRNDMFLQSQDPQTQATLTTSWYCIGGTSNVSYPNNWTDPKFPDFTPVPDSNPSEPTPPSNPTDITQRDAKLIGIFVMLYLATAFIKQFRYRL